MVFSRGPKRNVSENTRGGVLKRNGKAGNAGRDRVTLCTEQPRVREIPARCSCLPWPCQSVCDVSLWFQFAQVELFIFLWTTSFPVSGNASQVCLFLVDLWVLFINSACDCLGSSHSGCGVCVCMCVLSHPLTVSLVEEKFLILS